MDATTRQQIREIQAKLKELFPPEIYRIRELPGKGYWAFLPHQAIRQRLDEVVPDWQCDYSPLERLENSVIVRCAITILGVRKEAIGSVPLVAAEKDGKDVSRGSAADRASAEALKNAAEYWGVGQDLDDQGYIAKYLAGHTARLSDETGNKLRSLIAYLRSKGDLPPKNSSVTDPGPPRTQRPTTQQPKHQPPSSQAPAVANSIDRDLLLKEIDSLCKRKGVEPEIGKQILMDLYGVKGRSLLSDNQLLEFRDYLQSFAGVTVGAR